MFVRLFYLLLYIFSVVQSKIEIRDANVAVISRDDIGMIFYITIQNTDLCPYEVKVNMIECSEDISDRDRDSGFMYVIGGHMGVLKSKCFKNITMLYPNMYLHNRRGFCVISLKFKSQYDKIIQKRANITFDTYLSKKSMPAILRGYYTKNEAKNCSSVDLDPLNKCKPVDCHMKYLGTRNYFNKKWKRCQKVPICVTDPFKEMPDVIYTPSNNKCRDMEKSVTRADLQQIESGTSTGPCDESYPGFLNINCHFGTFNNITGLCDCDLGWTSAHMDKDQADLSSLFVFHMCNIEVSGWYDTNARKIKVASLIIGILAVVTAMIVIICSFVVQQCYNCIKAFENRCLCKSKSHLSVHCSKYSMHHHEMQHHESHHLGLFHHESHAKLKPKRSCSARTSKSSRSTRSLHSSRPSSSRTHRSASKCCSITHSHSSQV